MPGPLDGGGEGALVLGTAAELAARLNLAALREVAAKAGGDIRDRARLFLLPGVYHCRGGPGPDRFDGDLGAECGCYRPSIDNDHHHGAATRA